MKEKTVGSITKKAQVVRPHEPHFRPNGKECQYIGSPPICFKCGALLDPAPEEEDPS